MLTELPMVYRQYNTDDIFTANICGKVCKDIMRHAENNNTGEKSTDPWTGTNITVLKTTFFQKNYKFYSKVLEFFYICEYFVITTDLTAEKLRQLFEVLIIQKT